MVADLAAVEGSNALHDAAGTMGDIDILVNNAGVGVWGEFAQTSLADEMRMMQINADPTEVARASSPAF